MQNIVIVRPDYRWYGRVGQQIWMIMRLTVVLIIISTLSLSAKSYSQQINISVKNVPLEKVFKRIGKQTGYSFIWDKQTFKGLPRITTSMRSATLNEAIKTILDDLPLRYEIQGKVVLIDHTTSTKGLGTIPIPAPPLAEVTGSVLDSVTQQPLVGVTVKLKGGTVGTVTDAKGHFALNVPSDGVLEVSYLGYVSKEIPVNGRGDLEIFLSASTTGLNQLVVVGYGQQRKATMAGAVGVIASEALQSKPSTNVLDAIQGAMPGLTVTRSSGRPGAEGYSIKVRGISSVNSGTPLVIVDGVPNPLNTLDPANIKTITVLKDASAAIYGARAANGVILITTKKGESGKLHLHYSGNIALKQPTFLKKNVTTLQWAKMYNTAAVNDGRPVVFSDDDLEKMRAGDPTVVPGENKVIKGYPQFYTTTDWNDILYGTGFQQSHNVSLSGGTDHSTYRLSAGYFNTGGIYNVGHNVNNRYNFRVSYGLDITEKVRLDLISAYQQQDIKEPSMLYGSQTFVALSDALKMLPFIPERTPAGAYYQFQGYANPAQELEQGGAYKGAEGMLIGNAKLTYDIFSDLQLVGQFGITSRKTDHSEYFRTVQTYNWDESINSKPLNAPNSASYFNSKSLYKSYNAYLKYAHLFNGKHQLSMMLGVSRETYNYSDVSAAGQQFSSNSIFTLNLADPTLISNNGSAFAWALNSVFSRLTYVYNDKYILEGIARLDGSSRFAPDKRWSALFPAVSAAWRISEESFMKPLHFLDNLKFRVSWGQTGNQDINGLGYYDYIQLINIGGQYPFGSGAKTSGASLAGMASPGRTWETVRMQNAGIDISVLESRLSANFDYFLKKNNNMLVDITLPSVLGATPPTLNEGQLRTHGWELRLGWHDHLGQMKYHIKAGLSDTQNKLIYVGGDDAVNLGLVHTRQGYPMDAYFGYVSDGIIQNDQDLQTYKQIHGVPSNIAVGDAKYKDMDGDGTLSPFGDPAKGTKGDLVYLGTPIPRYTYFFRLNVQYAGFDAALFLQGVGKRSVIRGGDVSYYPFIRYWAPPLQYFYGKTWSPERPDAQYPRLTLNTNINEWNYTPSTNQVINTAYLRVKNFQLGYTLPQSTVDKLGLSRVRVYLSGDDLWVFSKGTWDRTYDPEEGADAYTYPFCRTYSFGIDVNF